MTIDLPDGFDEASTDVQIELLTAKRGSELAGAIADELDMDVPRSSQLNKEHKAAILLALRD